MIDIRVNTQASFLRIFIFNFNRGTETASGIGDGVAEEVAIFIHEPRGAGAVRRGCPVQALATGLYTIAGRRFWPIPIRLVLCLGRDKYLAGNSIDSHRLAVRKRIG